MVDHGVEGVGEVDAEDLLNRLEAENIHDVGRDEVGFSCMWVPGHAHGDRNPSAHINRESLLWRCKTCQRAGNLLELVKVGLPSGTTHVQSLAWLRENFGEVVRKPQGGSLTADLTARLDRASNRLQTPTQILPNEAETIGPYGIFAMDWRSDHEAAVYMRDVRGFAPEVLEDWGFGYDNWTQRVAIPIRSVDGTLVGFKGRSLGGSAVKYLLLGDTEDRAPRYGTGYGFDMHDARGVVFGLDRAIKMMGPKPKRLYMPEGELDVVACQSAGLPAACPGTTSITAEQLWLLRANVDEIAFMYDAGAGDDAIWGKVDPETEKFYPGHVQKLNPFFALYDTEEHEGDPASMTPEQIRALAATAKHWLAYVL